MITVHHLQDSRSQRVLWALEELELPYEITRYERDPETGLAPRSLREVHPLGFAPIVELEGRVLAETGPVLEALAAHAGALRPAPGTEAGDRCTYWLHYGEGSLMPVLLVALLTGRIKGPSVPFLIRPIARKIAEGLEGAFVNPRSRLHLDYVEAELSQRPWFAGEDLSIADMMMSFPLEAALTRLGVGERPAIRAWVERVHARPAYQRALERGGDYAYA